MPPPFRLEPPDKKPPYSRSIKVLYTKNEYSEGVKVEDWEKKLFAKPIDHNPLCLGQVNQFRSHYNRLGIGTEDNFSTTTGDALKQIFMRRKPVESSKLMENYYSFDDEMKCCPPCNIYCPEIPGDEYLTTMQYSYPVPHPYVMQRLAFPKIPWMQNRRYHTDDPRLSASKFFDDSFLKSTKEMQQYKGRLHKSYNFMTGRYSEDLAERSAKV